MRAIIKPKAAPGLALAEVPEPQVGSDEVLIKVLKSSICGTDVHINQWDDWAQKTLRPPLVIGHEFVGMVVDGGDNVKGFAPGDIVTGEGHLVCGHCRNCMAGQRHLCANTVGVGYHCDGAFAEYIALPVANVWHADPEIPHEVIAIFDPLGNAVHTALSFNLVGEDVLITGCGPIGCMAIPIVRHAGARHIVATDIHPYRLKLAGKMGATRVVDSRTTSLQEVQEELGMQGGFDVGLEMSGSAVAFNEMIKNMFHGGKIALLGILPDNTAIDWTTVIFNSLTMKGIYGRKMYETWYKTTAMLRAGLDIAGVITHKLPFTDFQKGFDLMSSGDCGKVILEWD